MLTLHRSTILVIAALIGLPWLSSCGPACPKPSTTVPNERSRPKLRALLIGVDYEIPGLLPGRNESPFALDAFQIANWVHSLGSCADIQFLAGNLATKEIIMDKLSWLSWQDGSPESDEAYKNSRISVFFFSGHGKLSANEDGNGFIIPYDGLHQTAVDGGSQEHLMISPREIFANNYKWDSLSLFILDSCNSGAFASYLEGNPSNRNIRLITASHAGQYSLNPPTRHNSLFTQALNIPFSRLSLDATLDEIVFSARAVLHNDPVWEKDGHRPEPVYYPLWSKTTIGSRTPFYKTTERTECGVPSAAVRRSSPVLGSNNINVIVDAHNCKELVPGSEVQRFMSREDELKKIRNPRKFSILSNTNNSNTLCELQVRPNANDGADLDLVTGDLLIQRSMPRIEGGIKVQVSKECVQFAKAIAERCPLCVTVPARDQAEYVLERSTLRLIAPGDRPWEHSNPVPAHSEPQNCAWRRVSTSPTPRAAFFLPESLSPRSAASDLTNDIERIYNLKFWQSTSIDKAMAPWENHRNVFPYYIQIVADNPTSDEASGRSGRDRPVRTIAAKSATPYRIILRKTPCVRPDCDDARSRYVYVCSIDSRGLPELLFPNNKHNPFMQALLPDQVNNCMRNGCVLADGIELSRKESRLIVVQARMEPYSDPGNACIAFRQEFSCKNSATENIRNANHALPGTASLTAALRVATPPPDLLDTFILTTE